MKKETRSEWVSAYREVRGPSPEAVERIAARLQSLGPAAAKPRRRVVPAMVVAATMLAAALLGLWIGRVELAAEETARVRVEAADQAERPTREGAVQSTGALLHANAAPTAPVAAPPDPAGEAQGHASGRAPGQATEPQALGQAHPPEQTPGQGHAPGQNSEPGRGRGHTHGEAQAPGRAPGHFPGPGHALAQASSDAKSTLPQELERLQRAQQELQEARFEQARASIAAYRAAFPNGVLHEEAEAVDTMARCRLEPERAESLARAFAARYPRSLFKTRVLGRCTSTPPPGHPLP